MQYEKGQIFPFLIAIICVVIIMVMITINLGQINIFKTETSNAADAGALAAPSVLSGILLGFGMQSENMLGYAIATMLAIIICICIPYIGWVTAIFIYIAFLVSQMIDYTMAYWQGEMGWSNAKKTALSYAFQNIGVNERRKYFTEFLQGVYGYTPAQQAQLSTTDITKYNNIYLQGDDPSLNCAACPKDATPATGGACGVCAKIRQYTQTGFSRFMQNGSSGYWPYGDITPSSSLPPANLVVGYGWNNDGNRNSYDSGVSYLNSGTGNLNFDNAIEVQVVGTNLYSIIPFSWLDSPEFFTCVSNMITGAVVIPWWLDFLSNPVKWVISTFVFWLLEAQPGAFGAIFPMGIDFTDNYAGFDLASQKGTVEQTTDSQIMVRVKRLKKDNDLGLWKFRYGTSGSTAISHLFPEHFSPFNDAHFETIAPVVFAPLNSFLCHPWSGMHGSWDDADRHLFESELIDAY